MPEIELDHPTLTHLLGYLTARQWTDAIRQNNVTTIAWELLKSMAWKHGRRCQGTRSDVR